MEKGRNITVLTLVKLAIALKIEPKDLLKINFVFSESDLDKLISSKNKK